MASRRLQHLAEQLATAAPRGAAPARALPASDPLPVGSANRGSGGRPQQAGGRRRGPGGRGRGGADLAVRADRPVFDGDRRWSLYDSTFSRLAKVVLGNTLQTSNVLGR
jgi:hypothetical protein